MANRNIVGQSIKTHAAAPLLVFSIIKNLEKVIYGHNSIEIPNATILHPKKLELNNLFKPFKFQ